MNILTGQSADFLQHRPLSADDYALLRIAFHIDGSPDIDIIIGTSGHFIHVNRNGVGNLIPCQMQRLFPNKLCYNETFRLVGDHIFRIILRPFRQVFLGLGQQAVQVHFFLGGDGHHPGKVVFFRVAGNNRQRPFLLNQVELVYYENNRTFGGLQAL